jgi:hypothetical protein
MHHVDIVYSENLFIDCNKFPEVTSIWLFQRGMNNCIPSIALTHRNRYIREDKFYFNLVPSRRSDIRLGMSAGLNKASDDAS